jgi:hypothetical protein
MKKSGSIRIGNQTSFASASMLDPFEFAVANGFTAFEFFPNRGFSGYQGWDERELNEETRRYIRHTASGKDVELTVHAPLEINPLHDAEDGRLYSTVEFAAQIGATLLNLHLDLSQGAERFVESLRRALLLTASTGFLPRCTKAVIFPLRMRGCVSTSAMRIFVKPRETITGVSWMDCPSRCQLFTCTSTKTMETATVT